MVALGGLLFGKLILFGIIIYFCCKSKMDQRRITDSADQTEDIEKTIEKMDQPPEYKSVVCRKEPPSFFESMINSQINPELNRNWAQDLHERTVDPEIDEAITKSRSASICSIDPSLQERIANHTMIGPSQAGPNFLVPPGYYGARRATLATLGVPVRSLPSMPNQQQQQQSRRERTYSMSPPVGAIWIGV